MDMEFKIDEEPTGLEGEDSLNGKGAQSVKVKVEDVKEEAEIEKDNLEGEIQFVTPVKMDRGGNRMPRELKNLMPYNNPGRLEESALFCFHVVQKKEEDDDDDEEPKIFREAWDHPDPIKREKWREAIRLEFRQMLKNMVWKRKGIFNLPEG